MALQALGTAAAVAVGIFYCAGNGQRRIAARPAAPGLAQRAQDAALRICNGAGVVYNACMVALRGRATPPRGRATAPAGATSSSKVAIQFLDNKPITNSLINVLTNLPKAKATDLLQALKGINDKRGYQYFRKSVLAKFQGAAAATPAGTSKDLLASHTKEGGTINFILQKFSTEEAQTFLAALKKINPAPYLYFKRGTLQQFEQAAQHNPIHAGAGAPPASAAAAAAAGTASHQAKDLLAQIKAGQLYSHVIPALSQLSASEAAGIFGDMTRIDAASGASVLNTSINKKLFAAAYANPQ
ncbi:MAG: hypothetical protein P0S96_00680 [Simkaniaceae bacterium]|nr:hypothetical protein [Candidatus Sacchlamyda saccharinae]